MPISHEAAVLRGQIGWLYRVAKTIGPAEPERRDDLLRQAQDKRRALEASVARSHAREALRELAAADPTVLVIGAISAPDYPGAA